MSHTDYLGSDVENYLESTRDTIEVSDSLNESNTNKRIVEPFMEFLGWPLRMPRDGVSVELQHTHDGTSVDYALVDNGRQRVFVETFEFEADVELGEEDMERLLDTFDWGILTNGYVYEIYRAVDGNTVLVQEIDLDDMEQKTDFLTYISHQSLTSDRTEKEAEEFDNCVRDKARIEDLGSQFEEMLEDSVRTVEDDRLDEEVELLTASLQDLANTDRYFGSGTSHVHHQGVVDGDTTDDRVDTDEVDETAEQMEATEQVEAAEQSDTVEGGEEYEDDGTYKYEPLHGDTDESPEEEPEEESDDDDSSSRRLSGLF